MYMVTLSQQFPQEPGQDLFLFTQDLPMCIQRTKAAWATTEEKTNDLILVASPSVSSASPAGSETLHCSLIMNWSGCSNSHPSILRLKPRVTGHQLPLNVTFALKLKISRYWWKCCEPLAGLSSLSRWLRQVSAIAARLRFHLDYSSLVIPLLYIL